MLTKKQVRQIIDISSVRFNDDSYSISTYFFQNCTSASVAIYKRTPNQEASYGYDLESIARLEAHSSISDKAFNDELKGFKQKIAEINAVSEVSDD